MHGFPYPVVAAERNGEVTDSGGSRVINVGTYSGPRDVAPPEAGGEPDQALHLEEQ